MIKGAVTDSRLGGKGEAAVIPASIDTKKGGGIGKDHRRDN